MACEIDEVTRCRKNPLCALRDFDAGLRQSDVAWPPLYEVGADLTFQFLDLHRERRLGDGAFIGGASEVPVAGEGAEVTQLTEGDHTDKLCLSIARNNTIRPDQRVPPKRRTTEETSSHASGGHHGRKD